MSKRNLIQLAVLILLCVVFVAHALSLSFTQDDSFISYRYVKNFLNGDGLVFNTGEQVEGYTNFFFIILMILFGRFGSDIIIASKLIGLASGLGIIFLSFLWMKKLPESGENFVLPLAVPFLLIVNQSFAYWAISGMETLLFSFLILLGIYLAAQKKPIFIPIFAVAALTRPEGALIFVSILVYHVYVKNISISRSFGYFAVFLILIIPQFIFRLVYYGDILPNPFYAKTGWSLEYLKSGIEYLWLFLKYYGLYGGLLIIPVLSRKYFSDQWRMVLAVVLIFALYILLIGGDVLNCFRFFVPIITLLYMLLVLSVVRLTGHIEKPKTLGSQRFITGLIIIIGAFSFLGPRAHINGFLDAERGLINKMTYYAFILKPYVRYNKLVACSTIGAFSYYSEAHVLDMLGLTDRNIAHNPQAFVNIRSTWKERNYNVPYIMQLDPDYIIFSTSLKPSAPAEKALFLSSEFRQAYYPVFNNESGMKVIYKRRPDYSGEDTYFDNPFFVELFAESINRKLKNDYEHAFAYALQSIAEGPPDFYLPLSILGEIQLEFGKPSEGVTFLKEAIKRSGGYATLSSDYLAKYYEVIGDTASADELYQTLLSVNKLD